MLEFLINATHPNGKIALFNDSTEEIANSTIDLLEYAKNIGLNFSTKKSKDFSYSGFI